MAVFTAAGCSGCAWWAGRPHWTRASRLVRPKKIRRLSQRAGGSFSTGQR